LQSVPEGLSDIDQKRHPIPVTRRCDARAVSTAVERNPLRPVLGFGSQLPGHAPHYRICTKYPEIIGRLV
jgi:hypothetical protein